MATFFTDADLTGAGEFVEGEVWLATEFTVPDGTATFRWRWPAVAPVVTPQIRVYNAGGTLVAGPISFDSTTTSAWNTAGVGSPVSLSAGTYRVVVNTTRYPARSGFFSGGSITRGDITGVQSRFGSPGSAPTSTSTATYFVDIDFTATAGTVTGTGTLTLPALTATGTGIATATGTGAPSLAALSGSGAGTASATGSGALSLAALTAVGAGTASATGSGVLTLPAVTATGAGGEPGAETFGARPIISVSTRRPELVVHVRPPTLS